LTQWYVTFFAVAVARITRRIVVEVVARILEGEVTGSKEVTGRIQWLSALILRAEPLRPQPAP
jgi:hypothetical protein